MLHKAFLTVACLLCLSNGHRATCAEVTPNAAVLQESEIPLDTIVAKLLDTTRQWHEVEIEYLEVKENRAFHPRESYDGYFKMSENGSGEFRHLERIPTKPEQRTPREFEVIWTDAGIQMSENSSEEVLLRTKAEVERSRQILCQSTDCSFWESIGIVMLAMTHFPAFFTEPRECFPLLLAESKEEIRDRFSELHVREKDDYLFLFATPKDPLLLKKYSQYAICIDRETFAPVASRRKGASGCRTTTLIFTSFHVNGENITVPDALAREPGSQQ